MDKDIKVEPDIFLELMKFAYTECVDTNKENFLSLFSAANQYGMDVVKRACLKKIDSKCVIQVYQQNLKTYNFREISDECIRIICSCPFEIFKSDDFKKLDKEFLKIVLNVCSWRCSPRDIKTAIKEWMEFNNGEDVKDIISLEQSILKKVYTKIYFDGNHGYSIKSNYCYVRLKFLQDVTIFGFGVYINPKLNNFLLRVFNPEHTWRQIVERKIQNEEKSNFIEEFFLNSIVVKKNQWIEIKFEFLDEVSFRCIAELVVKSEKIFIMESCFNILTHLIVES